VKAGTPNFETITDGSNKDRLSPLQLRLSPTKGFSPCLIIITFNEFEEACASVTDVQTNWQMANRIKLLKERQRRWFVFFIFKASNIPFLIICLL
jgi:mRNA deadenylase 3'-5' endonuclease subunit Ccr4